MEDRHSGFRYTTFKRRWISYPERLGTAASIGSEGPTASGKGRDAACGAGARAGTSERRNTERALA